jgi:uncharacterized repeat protein (TIGR02543 family)
MLNTISLKAGVLVLTLFVLGFTACGQPDGDPTKTYTVTFVADGGSPAPAAQTVDESDTATEPPLMTKSGYQFNGWYDNIQFLGTPWNFSAGIIDADLTLYARWVTFRAVTEISGVTIAAVQGSDTVLTGTVLPANATNKNIIWTVKSGSATVSGNSLTASASGTVVITATITNGKTPGENYTQDVIVDVWASNDPRVAFIGGWFAAAGTPANTYNSDITLTADKFRHIDTWGYWFDIDELEWTAAGPNPEAATNAEYTDGYTITGTILRRGGSNGPGDDIFGGATTITIYLNAAKDKFVIPAWTSLNTGARYTKK